MRRAIDQLPHALHTPVLRQALAGRRAAVFLDYDGTLTPIVARPELAVLSEPSRAVVRELARHLPLAIISGRDRADVERLVGITGLTYAGSHGFDIFAPALGHFAPDLVGDAGPLLDQAEAMLRQALAGLDGALIERKRFTIAVHDRLVAPPEVPRVEAAAQAVCRALPALAIKPGKRVFELHPAVDWHKGKAVLWLLGRLGLDRAEVVPLFIGDDVTDEDAFQALQTRGVGIVAADPAADPGRTSFAAARVDGPDQVIALLRRLADARSA